MATTSTAGPFRIERRPDGVAVVLMDIPGESVNTLKPTFTDDFAKLFDELERDTSVAGVVFASGKPESFLVGADVKMLEPIQSSAEAEAMVKRGHRAMDRIARFPKPVVAAIHGPCLGGGLEVAMACHARVASDDRKTKLGLPEIQLGLLPGAAGTQRLPPLVGVEAALDMMLTGKHLGAAKAKKLGLVDEVVPRAVLVEAAAKRALAPADAKKKNKPISAERIQELALTRTGVGRKVLFDQARKRTLAKTRGNYPAATEILEVVKTGLAQGFEAGLEAEAQAFGRVVVSPQAKNLIQIFHATTALKKDSGVDDPTVKAKRVEKVGMLGAGLMGAGIAYVTAAQARIPVRLKDKDDAGVGRGLRHVREQVDERVKKKSLTRLEGDEVLARVTGGVDYESLRDADVVIEAVFEDLALKHRVVKDVEAVTRRDAIFASNTSSLPITKIAAASARPETVIGMHYFSPVEKMPLLEIIVTDHTAPWVTATCVELGKKQGKTVIVVRDGVGFYTSRILAPYMNEAAYLLAEGVPVERIDDALVQWGFPVGPITLLDEVGIDVGEKVGHIMHEAFGERMTAPPGMERLVADQRFGKKNQRGFYVYGEKRRKSGKQVDPTVYGVLGVEPKNEMEAARIAERCALQMVNEAALCFGEGILRSARDGDIGAVFGLGFPPFRGGPFRFPDELGPKQVVARLESLRDLHGKRFTPAPVLVAMAKTGAKFHGDPPPRPAATHANVT